MTASGTGNPVGSTSRVRRDDGGWYITPDTPITELLVPMGPDPTWKRAADAAVRYGRRWRLPVRLLHVRTDSDRVADDREDRPDVTAEARRLRAATRLEITGEEVVGDGVAAAITAASTGTSLILLVTDHVDQLTTPGSVGATIIRSAPHPIVVCGPHCVDPPDRGSVVVALDGSERAEAALRPAVGVTIRTRAPLWAVHVAPESSAGQAGERRRRGERVSLSAPVREVADRLVADDIDARWQLVLGDPVSGIMQVAHNQRADLIVVTTHGASGVTDRALGEVAAGLVRTMSVPVLIVPAVPPVGDVAGGGPGRDVGAVAG